MDHLDIITGLHTVVRKYLGDARRMSFFLPVSRQLSSIFYLTLHCTDQDNVETLAVDYGSISCESSIYIYIYIYTGLPIVTFTPLTLLLLLADPTPPFRNGRSGSRWSGLEFGMGCAGSRLSSRFPPVPSRSWQIKLGELGVVSAQLHLCTLL